MRAKIRLEVAIWGAPGQMFEEDVPEIVDLLEGTVSEMISNLPGVDAVECFVDDTEVEDDMYTDLEDEGQD